MTTEATKIVLIGGPSSGKSTLIEELDRRGYNTIEESARKVLEERGHIKDTPEETIIRQRMIYERQVEAEKCSGLVFLDRGVLDVIAYSEHLLGYIPFKVADPKYNKICNLERLPFIDDGLRAESGDEEAQEIHEKITNTYQKHNYSLLNIPIIEGKTLEESVSKRTDYLLSRLEKFL